MAEEKDLTRGLFSGNGSQGITSKATNSIQALNKSSEKLVEQLGRASKLVSQMKKDSEAIAKSLNGIKATGLGNMGLGLAKMSNTGTMQQPSVGGNSGVNVFRQNQSMANMASASNDATLAATKRAATGYSEESGGGGLGRFTGKIPAALGAVAGGMAAQLADVYKPDTLLAMSDIASQLRINQPGKFTNQQQAMMQFGRQGGRNPLDAMAWGQLNTQYNLTGSNLKDYTESSKYAALLNPGMSRADAVKGVAGFQNVSTLWSLKMLGINARDPITGKEAKPEDIARQLVSKGLGGNKARWDKMNSAQRMEWVQTSLQSGGLMNNALNSIYGGNEQAKQVAIGYINADARSGKAADKVTAADIDRVSEQEDYKSAPSQSLYKTTESKYEGYAKQVDEATTVYQKTMEAIASMNDAVIHNTAALAALTKILDAKTAGTAWQNFKNETSPPNSGGDGGVGGALGGLLGGLLGTGLGSVGKWAWNKARGGKGGGGGGGGKKPTVPKPRSPGGGAADAAKDASKAAKEEGIIGKILKGVGKAGKFGKLLKVAGPLAAVANLATAKDDSEWAANVLSGGKNDEGWLGTALHLANVPAMAGTGIAYGIEKAAEHNSGFMETLGSWFGVPQSQIDAYKYANGEAQSTWRNAPAGPVTVPNSPLLKKPTGPSASSVFQGLAPNKPAGPHLPSASELPPPSNSGGILADSSTPDIYKIQLDNGMWADERKLTPAQQNAWLMKRGNPNTNSGSGYTGPRGSQQMHDGQGGATANQAATGLIAEAMHWIGTPYSWGGGNLKGPTYGIAQGRKTKGFDCSSFVQYVFAKYGVNLPRTSQAQARSGKEVKRSQARQGDLLIFTFSEPNGHVAIYLGKNKMIHAPKTGEKIHVSDVPWKFVSHIRRVIGANLVGTYDGKDVGDAGTTSTAAGAGTGTDVSLPKGTRAGTIFNGRPPLIFGEYASDSGSGTGLKDNGMVVSLAAGASRAAQVYNTLVHQGWTAAAAAGAIGNLMQESGVDPARNQDGGGAGRGIAQWSVGQRWNDEQKWTKKNRLDPMSLEGQTAFMMYELKSRGQWNVLSRMTDVHKATKYFSDKYEVPGDPQMEKRYAFADAAFSQFGGKKNKAYSEGAWRVNRDQTANIHEGEMILSRPIADVLRGAISEGFKGGGGGSGAAPVVVNMTVNFDGMADQRQAAALVKTFKDTVEKAHSLSRIRKR